MQSYSAASFIETIINNICLAYQAELDRKELLRNIPQFTGRECFDIFYSITNLFSVAPETSLRLNEEGIHQIPRIDKDTLMPKDLSQQKNRVVSPNCLSPRSSVSSKKKISFIRKQSSGFTDKLKSISFNQKKVSRKNSKRVPDGIYKPIENEQIQLQQQNEDSIKGLREKTQNRLRYIEQQKKIKELKEKQYLEKKEKFSNIIQEDPKGNITYDFEGDFIPNNLQQHENMKLNATRTMIGYAKKKLKEGISRLNTPSESKIQPRKRMNHSEKEESSFTIRQQQLPMFPMKALDSDTKYLKLQEYKKCYGSKYSRLGQRHTTIQINSRNKTQQRHETTVETRHLREKNYDDKNIESKGTTTNRKLALPKLNGKYKILDRYEQK